MRNFMSFLNSGGCKVTTALALVATASVASQAAVTIPDTGIDMSGYVQAAILLIGGVVAAVVGGYFAFLGIKAGMAWAGKALR